MAMVRNVVLVFFIYLVFFIAAVLLAKEFSVEAPDKLSVLQTGYEANCSRKPAIDLADTASFSSGNILSVCQTESDVS